MPFADTSTYPVPDGVTDEEVLMLADILPTGYEVGVLNGSVRPGDVVAVVGAGPIGLSAIMGARLFSPSHIVAIDLADSRLEAAKQFGADVTVNNGREDPLERHHGPDRRPRRRRRHRGGRRPGHLRAGRHAGPPRRARRQHRRARRAGDAAPRRRCGSGTSPSPPAWSTPTRRRPCCACSRAGQLDASRFVTHHFALDEFDEAYDVFARAADTGALKVVLSR